MLSPKHLAHTSRSFDNHPANGFEDIDLSDVPRAPRPEPKLTLPSSPTWSSDYDDSESDCSVHVVDVESQQRVVGTGRKGLGRMRWFGRKTKVCAIFGVGVIIVVLAVVAVVVNRGREDVVEGG